LLGKLVSTQESPQPPENEAVSQRTAEQIARSFKPTSGVRLVHEDGRFLLETLRETEMTDQEALDYAIEVFHLQREPATYDEEEKQEMISAGRLQKSRENIGGFGITTRNLLELETVIPGITQELLSEKGRIVFIGNGLSTAPVEILQKMDPNTAPEIVLVDLFEYSALYQDLLRLRNLFQENGIPWPGDLDDYLAKATALVGPITRGKVKTIRYVFGDGNPPEQIREADLMVNSYGPPKSTMCEQIHCLKRGGRLFTYQRDVPQASFARIAPIMAPGGKKANIVTRIA
jgi:hypothetical protein